LANLRQAGAILDVDEERFPLLKIQICPVKNLRAVEADLRVIAPLIGSLDVSGYPLHDDFANTLARCIFLRSLNIIQCRLHQSVWKAIVALPCLETLDACFVRMGAKEAAILARSKTLKELSLSDTGLSPEEFRTTLRNKPELRYLYVGNLPLGVSEARLFARLPLRSLSVSNETFDDDCMKLLRKHPSLDSLSLSGCGITSASLAHLATLPRLEVLYLEEADLTAPFQGNITFRRLMSADFSSSKFQPGFFCRMIMPEMNYLDVNRVKLSIEDMIGIARCRKLESLGMVESQVNDAGLDTLVRHPRGLSILAPHTQITRAAAARFVAKVPGSDISGFSDRELSWQESSPKPTATRP
jgi:hypothetical protein